MGTKLRWLRLVNAAWSCILRSKERALSVAVTVEEEVIRGVRKKYSASSENVMMPDADSSGKRIMLVSSSILKTGWGVLLLFRAA